jgi:hypothetical protein
MAIPTALKGSEFLDGPPCLQQLAYQGIEPGMRNIVLTNIAIYFKSQNDSTFAQRLFDFNQTLREPLPAGEIQQIAGSVAAKAYFYFCNKEPLLSYCDRRKCMERPFGIGRFEGVPLKGVTVESVDIYTYDPEIFIVTIGVNDVSYRIQLLGGIDELTNQNTMRKLCARKFSVYPDKVQAGVWDTFLQELCARFNRIPVGEDSTLNGIISEYLRDFISNRVQTDLEAIGRGNVYNQGDGIYVFRFLDFVNFLTREGFRDLNRNQIDAVLQELGAETNDLLIKGRKYYIRKIKGEFLQTEPFAVQTFEEAF